MTENNQNTSIVFYDDGLELHLDSQNDTIWATQGDIVELFDIDQSVVARHIKNIFSSGEVEEKSNMQKMHIPNSDKPVKLYSLDIILAVGYKTNSGRAIQFRQWATKRLKEYLIDWYSINQKNNSKKNSEISSHYKKTVPYLRREPQGPKTFVRIVHHYFT